MINDIQNNVLKAAEQQIESQLTPPVRKDYMKIVVAGMKVALDKGPKGILASLAQSKDPITDCVKGAINVVGLLGMQSRGTMPMKAAIPATMSLIIHALDFADKAGIVKVGPAELSRAAHLFGNIVTTQHFGISTDMLRTAAQKLEKVAGDPTNMERMKRVAGMVRDPNASSPTPMPESDGEGAAP